MATVLRLRRAGLPGEPDPDVAAGGGVSAAGPPLPYEGLARLRAELAEAALRVPEVRVGSSLRARSGLKGYGTSEVIGSRQGSVT
jgi:hypothetical protein